MTEVEQFLANQKHFYCERLRASITQVQCKINREGKTGYGRTPTITPMFACVDCPGLPKEPIEMAKNNRGTCITCKRDMVEVKGVFIGKQRQAFQLFTSESKHINIHPYCLHLWCAIEGDGLPDFGKDGTI